jgi:hypothetical protein
MRPNFEITMVLRSDAAILLAGQIQLALRHPQNNGSAAEAVSKIVAYVIECFRAGNMPAHAELAALGNDPSWDQ